MCGTHGKLLEWIETQNIKFHFRLKFQLKSIIHFLSYNLPKLSYLKDHEELKFATIDLTDEMREMDGSVIECRYVDPD